MLSPCWSFFFRHPRHCLQGSTSGQTANGKFYCEDLKRLKEDIPHKRPDKWKNNNWFFHHDKAPAHTSLVFRHFLTSINIIVIPHTPIRLTSPPATFSNSPRWNYGWKGVFLTRVRRSTQNRKRLSTYSHLRTSRDAWNFGKHAGIAVYMSKGTISKETVETRSYGKKLFLWSNSPNFWVAPRTCKMGTCSMLIWHCKKCSTNYFQWPISELLCFKRTV